MKCLVRRQQLRMDSKKEKKTAADIFLLVKKKNDENNGNKDFLSTNRYRRYIYIYKHILLYQIHYQEVFILSFLVEGKKRELTANS